jgi:beta-glucosidase/6-phospho-beta-glucosidase/beta-galactosidase
VGAYLSDHLSALRRTVADGVNVTRHHAWSLLDNFEWEHGYAKRFGIVRVDYATQERATGGSSRSTPRNRSTSSRRTCASPASSGRRR